MTPLLARPRTQAALKARPKLEAKVQTVLSQRTQAAATRQFASRLQEAQDVLKEVLQDTD